MQKGDVIYRQQAIDYCEALMNAERLQQTDDWGYGRERYNQTECIMHYIENMPSAQPEKTYCGYDVTELIGFATVCRRAGVDEKDLKNFAQDCEFAWKVMQKEVYSAIEEAFEKYSDINMCQDAEDTEEVIETQVGSLIFRDKVQYGIQEKLKAAYRDGYTAAYEMHCCGGSGARMVGESDGT